MVDPVEAAIQRAIDTIDFILLEHSAQAPTRSSQLMISDLLARSKIELSRALLDASPIT